MPFWIFVAVVLSLIPHDIMYGPQAALIAESFTGTAALFRRIDRLPACVDHCRWPGAADRGGAVRDVSQSWVAIAVYITICSVISVVATAMLTDYTGKDISAEYAFGED